MRSSATLRRLRTDVTKMPWCLGLPYTMPLEIGFLRDPRRTATRYTTKPCFAL
jgi:hypothetical protein